MTYDVLPAKTPRKARLAYTVHTGPVYRLDSISYVGFPPVADSLIRARRRRTYLHKGDPFNASNLSQERSRLERLFRQNGYFYYSAPYATYYADTFQVKHRVQLQLRPAENMPARVRRRWYIGNTHVRVRNTAGDSLTEHAAFGHYTFDFPKGKIPLRYILWHQGVAHRHGELYRLRHQETPSKS